MPKTRVSDGARTRDSRIHNPSLEYETIRESGANSPDTLVESRDDARTFAPGAYSIAERVAREEIERWLSGGDP